MASGRRPIAKPEGRKHLMREPRHVDSPVAPRTLAPNPAVPGRHALREQEAVWSELLAMGQTIVDSLEKSVAALRDGRIDVVSEVKELERNSDREEVRIEQSCLRILALFEPVASDLRRMATILKVSRDWERIADLAARIARRARKLACGGEGTVVIPDSLKMLASDVLDQTRASQEALVGRDSQRARVLIDGDRSIDRGYRRFRREMKDALRRDPGQLDAWLQLLSIGRHLERIADHATGIAQTVIYLEEGIIVRHKSDTPSSTD
jgi:phosphate transport system protein